MAIIASPDTLDSHDTHQIPLPDSLKGRVIALRLDDKKGGHSLTVINVYLKSGRGIWCKS